MLEYFNIALLLQILGSFTWLLYLIPPVILAVYIEQAWLYYAQSKYISAIQWSVLEIRIPRMIERGPKVMEQFYNALHAMRNGPGDWKDKYLDGEVTRWFSLELVSVGGRTRIFLRVPTKLKVVVESMLYGQYPDIEINEVPDYIDQMPKTFSEVQKIGYDLAGVELALAKDNVYPINTYQNFESIAGDERIIDPMSMIMEIFSKLKPEEIVWMQIIISPADNKWRDKGAEVINKLRDQIKKTAGEVGGMVMRSPGEDQNMKAIEHKCSQVGFDTIIRHIYFAKEINKDLGYRALTAYFNQFASDLNSFKKDTVSWTRVQAHKWPFVYVDKRTDTKKEEMLAAYRFRVFWNGPHWVDRILNPLVRFRPYITRKTSILSSEELATIFHMPTNVVLTAPTMDRIESKRVSPPSNLPG